MRQALLYPVVFTDAAKYALVQMNRSGIRFLYHPAPEVTHLFLDVPSFTSDGLLRSNVSINSILERLPDKVTIIGGNLTQSPVPLDNAIDLLTDSKYLAQNARITAHCAVMLAAQKLPVILPEAKTIIIGWGRIGKCLTAILHGFGCHPIVCTRRESDRAILGALGHSSISFDQLSHEAQSSSLIINTVPSPILDMSDLADQDCIVIDLASSAGVLGENICHARGLPGKYAPVSSGKLIADTVIRKLLQEDSI